jgi:hypothetical protein
MNDKVQFKIALKSYRSTYTFYSVNVFLMFINDSILLSDVYNGFWYICIVYVKSLLTFLHCI